MANLRKVIYINEEDYSTLINGDSLVIDGTTYTYEENALYVIKNAGPPEYAETAGYATNAGTSLVAVTDASGNNIAATYGKKPLIIEVDESDHGTTLTQGTYDSITQALALDRQVILKLTRNNSDVIYLLLVEDFSTSNSEYRFGAVEDQTSYFGYVDDGDYFEYFTRTISDSQMVVHKEHTETITGNKTFTGTVSLGSKATATTPAATDNDTSVATTAFVKTVVANSINELPSPMIFKGSLGTGGTITALPSAATSNEGYTYKVITNGTYGGQSAKVGDTFVSDGSNWIYIPSGDEPSGTVTNVKIQTTSPIAIDDSSAITTSGTRTISHNDSGVTAGTYKSVTVDAKGHVTGGTNPTTLAGYGITDAIDTSSTAQTKAGSIKASKFITRGGSSSQVVRGDGSLVDPKLLPQYEAYLKWGGKNFAGSYGPIDAAMVSELGAPRTMFAKAAGIAVEYSTDGGNTWVDYGATNEQKVALFSVGQSFYTGKNTSASGVSTNNMLRVSLYTSAASIYTSLNKFVIHVSTSGSSGCYCTIRCRTQQNYEDNVDTWITRAEQVPIQGWSGYNVINVPTITTYGNIKASLYGELQFIFGYTGISETGYSGLTINRIFGFGGVGWTCPSNMAKTGHLYSFNASQDAIFPAQVQATSFKKTGGTSSQFLKADGSVDETSYGTYSKPSGGIPKTDLASAVQTSLGKADTALQSFTETDPTVPSHVKSITQQDITNWNNKLSSVPVTSVNGMTGDVTIEIPENQLSNDYSPSTLINEDLVLESGDTYEEAFGKLEKLINDNEEITAAALTNLDERIPVIDQELSETSENPVQNKVITQAIIDNEYVVSTALNNINDRLENKQDTLISGTNLKTINNQSLLGSGNISISGSDNFDIIDVNAFIRVDINKDGLFTNDDLTKIGYDVVHTTTIDEDVNNDGVITIDDVTKTNNIIVNKSVNKVLTLESNPYSLITASFSNSKIPILRLTFPGNLVHEILIQKATNDPIYYGECIRNVDVPSDGAGLTLPNFILKIFVRITETEACGIIGYVATQEGLATKQDTLVSGTNIKTINNESILGSGNITIQGGSGGDTNVIETIKVNGTVLTPDTNKAVDITVPTTLDSISDGTTRKLSNYLPLSGGTMTGAITVAPGDGKGLLFSTTSNINVSGTTNTILGFYNGTYIIGHTAYPVNIRGNATRPQYNGNQLALYSDIPSAVTESTVSGWGFTKNAGTVTGVKMNGTTNNPTSGVVDLGTVITEHQDISGKANKNGSFNEEFNVSALNIDADGEQINLWADYNSQEKEVTLDITESNGGCHLKYIFDESGDTKYIATTDDLPTKTSDLTNDSGFLTTHQSIKSLNTNNTSAQTASASETIAGSGTINLHKVAKTGTYSDLIGKPTIPAAQVQSDWNATSGMGVILNKPTIPTVNNATLTIQKNGTTVNTFTANASSNVTANIQVNELPTVSSSDNGKILQVVNGAWSLVTPVTVYTGTSTPNSSLGINGDLYVLTS